MTDETTARAGARPEGRAMRGAFGLDPTMAFLNHGSYGAVPLSVTADTAAWRTRIERQPVLFFASTLPGALRAAAGILADAVGAEVADIAFVENATAGVNAVLRSIRLGPGETILLTDHGYGAVRNAARHAAALAGASIVEVALPWPDADAAAIVDAVVGAIDGRTRLVAVDHVTSPTALVLPVEEIARACRRRGVPVLIDGAHAPGMLDLDVGAVGADWYVGNAHKWLFAARGCGFLHARPAARGDLHPAVISHGYGQGFAAEFDWTGTRDPAPWLSVDGAIAFHRGLGSRWLQARNAALAREAAAMLARVWRTRVLTPDGSPASMATVALPTGLGEPTREGARAIHDRLWGDHQVEVPVIAFAGRLHVRVSAQIYNELDDYRRLAAAIAPR
ncbi:MAG: aminotransferase class V-fold PLP-dependent enzyme [Alphaproteobacteria bacterium]